MTYTNRLYAELVEEYLSPDPPGRQLSMNCQNELSNWRPFCHPRFLLIMQSIRPDTRNDVSVIVLVTTATTG